MSLQRQEGRPCCHGNTHSGNSQLQTQRAPADDESQDAQQTHSEGQTNSDSSAATFSSEQRSGLVRFTRQIWSFGCNATYPIRVPLEFRIRPKSTSRQMSTSKRRRPRYPNHLEITNSHELLFVILYIHINVLCIYFFLFTIFSMEINTEILNIKNVQSYTYVVMQKTKKKITFPNPTVGKFEYKIQIQV